MGGSPGQAPSVCLLIAQNRFVQFLEKHQWLSTAFKIKLNLDLQGPSPSSLPHRPLQSGTTSCSSVSALDSRPRMSLPSLLPVSFPVPGYLPHTRQPHHPSPVCRLSLPSDLSALRAGVRVCRSPCCLGCSSPQRTQHRARLESRMFCWDSFDTGNFSAWPL